MEDKLKKHLILVNVPLFIFVLNSLISMIYASPASIASMCICALLVYKSEKFKYSEIEAQSLKDRQDIVELRQLLYQKHGELMSEIAKSKMSGTMMGRK